MNHGALSLAIEYIHRIVRSDELVAAVPIEIGARFGMGSGDDDPTSGKGNINRLATMGFFPVDDQVLDYMRLSGRDEALIATVDGYVGPICA